MATPAPAYSPDSYHHQNNQYPMQPQQPQAQYAQQQYSQPQQHQAYPMSSPIQQPQQPMYHQAGSPPPMEEKNSYQQNVHSYPPQMNGPSQYASAQAQGPAGSAPPAGNSQFANAVPLQGLSMNPAPVDCPACKHRALTRVERHSGNTTHAWALATWCFTLCLCFIPYLIDSLKDVEHFCGNCGTRLARWHKSGHVEVFLHA